jgi:hypothetical protein
MAGGAPAPARHGFAFSPTPRLFKTSVVFFSGKFIRQTILFFGCIPFSSKGQIW